MPRDQDIKIEKRRPGERSTERDSDESESQAWHEIRKYRWFLAVTFVAMAVGIGLIINGSIGLAEVYLATAVLVVLIFAAGAGWLLQKLFLATGSQY